MSPILVVAAMLVSLAAWSGPALAQFASIRTNPEDDAAVRVNGEVYAFVEYYSTNFAGDYNGDTRGDSAWDGAFDDGLKDAYSNTQTRIRDAELQFRRTTSIGETWRMHTEIELEFKPRNHNRDPQRFDLEEASATFFRKEGGPFFQIGFVEDKKLYEGGLTDETVSEDAKGNDEEPSIRFGWYKGALDFDLRYHSIVLRDSAIGLDLNSDGDTKDSGETVTKDINETLLRVQVEYKIKELLDLLAIYQVVNSSNKEDDKFQGVKQDPDVSADALKEYKAASLDSSTVIGLGVQLYFGDIRPIVNYESRHHEEDDGEVEFDVSVIEAGVLIGRLGPGNLWLQVELGNSDISGDDVAFTQFSGEYHFVHGSTKHGPGFKNFSNDAGEKLQGTIIYYGGDWVF
jgi:hypothetical protein